MGLNDALCDRAKIFVYAKHVKYVIVLIPRGINPCSAEFVLRNYKHISISNYFSTHDTGCFACIFITMAADDLAMQGASASAVIVSILFFVEYSGFGTIYELIVYELVSVHRFECILCLSFIFK